MPSPVGHSLAALVVVAVDHHVRTTRRPDRPPTFRSLAVLTTALALVALAPDLDFLPGFFMGVPDLLHRGNFHSLGAAVFVGLEVGLIARLVRPGNAIRAGVLTAAAYASHVVLDLFAADRQQWGVPVWWPLSDHAYVLPVPLFVPIRRQDTVQAFFPSLLQPHNIQAVLWEIVVMSTTAAAVWAGLNWIRRQETRRMGAAEQTQ